MELSAKADYGLRSVVHLALREGHLVQICDIASKERIPLKFLEQILLELKKAGIVMSKRGVGGGYTLALSPDSITLGQIIKIFERSLGPVGGIERMRNRDDLTEAESMLRSSWLAIEDAVSSILEKVAIAEIVEAYRQTHVDRQMVTHGTAWF